MSPSSSRGTPLLLATALVFACGSPDAGQPSGASDAGDGLDGGGGGDAAELRVEAPTLTPAPGAYVGPLQLTVRSATDGATVLATLDPAAGPGDFQPVAGPLILDASATVRAFARLEGRPDSEIVTGAYVVEPEPGALTLTGGLDLRDEAVARFAKVGLFETQLQEGTGARASGFECRGAYHVTGAGSAVEIAPLRLATLEPGSGPTRAWRLTLPAPQAGRALFVGAWLDEDDDGAWDWVDAAGEPSWIKGAERLVVARKDVLGYQGVDRLDACIIAIRPRIEGGGVHSFDFVDSSGSLTAANSSFATYGASGFELAVDRANLDVPSGLSAEGPASGAVRLSWTLEEAPLVRALELSFAPAAEGVPQPIVLGADARTHLVEGLADGTYYGFGVRTVDLFGGRSERAEISFLPGPPAIGTPVGEVSAAVPGAVGRTRVLSLAGRPAVAFEQGGEGSPVALAAWSGTEWSSSPATPTAGVRAGFGWLSAADAGGVVFVAYPSTTGQAGKVLRRGATEWIEEAPGIELGPETNAAACSDGSLLVATRTSSGAVAVVRRAVDGTWSPLGEAIAATGSQRAARGEIVCAGTTPVLAYEYGTVGQPRAVEVRRHSDGGWEAVGDAQLVAQAQDPRLAVDSQGRLLLATTGSMESGTGPYPLEVRRFEAGSWSLLGAAAPSLPYGAYGRPDLLVGPDDAPVLVVSGWSGPPGQARLSARVVRFDGVWRTLGEVRTTGHVGWPTAALGPDRTVTVGFRDTGLGDRLSVVSVPLP